MGSSIRLGRYRHYKGKEYRVITCAKHSETLEDMVVYEALYDNEVSRIWVRPLKMFLEEIVIADKKIQRFEFIGK